MKFGSKEWFEKLEELFDFPSVFAFFIASDMKIYSEVVETKAEDLWEVQYKMLEPPFMLGREKTALASLKRCNSAQDYYEEVVRLKEVWRG